MSDQKAPAELILGSAVRLSEDDRPNLKSAYLHYNQQAAIMAEQLAEAQAKIKIFEQITKLQAQEGAARMAESFDLRSKITNLELDIALLRLEQKWTACAYCTEHWDYTNLEDGAAKVAAHVAICPEHPMRALEAQNAEFTRERDALAAAIDLMGQVACYDHAWKDLTDAQRDEICRLSDNALGVVHGGGQGKILEAHDAALVEPLNKRIEELEKSEMHEIEQRDYREEKFNEVVAVLGVETEYSNLRGFDEIISDCEDVVAEKDAEIKRLKDLIIRCVDSRFWTRDVMTMMDESWNLLQAEADKIRQERIAKAGDQ